MELGCKDHGCLFQINKGQSTNGGCNCIRNKAIHTEAGWVIPVTQVQIMVNRAIQTNNERRK